MPTIPDEKDVIATWQALNAICKEFTESEPDFLRGLDAKTIAHRMKEANDYNQLIPVIDYSEMNQHAITNFTQFEKNVKRSLRVTPADEKISKEIATDMTILNGFYKQRLDKFKDLVNNINHRINECEKRNENSFSLASYHYFLAHLYSECPHTSHVAYPEKQNAFHQDFLSAESILTKLNVGEPLTQLKTSMLNECRRELAHIHNDVPNQSSYSTFFKPLTIIGIVAGLWTGGIGTALTYGAVGLLGDDYLRMGVDAIRENCCRKKV